jgi:hypothetical protein
MNEQLVGPLFNLLLYGNGKGVSNLYEALGSAELTLCLLVNAGRCEPQHGPLHQSGLQLSVLLCSKLSWLNESSYTPDSVQHSPPPHHSYQPSWPNAEFFGSTGCN